MCKMQVHVILQSCSVPSYLISQCDDKTKVCNFSCRDPSLELHGNSALSCGDHMGWVGWTGNLPFCRGKITVNKTNTQLWKQSLSSVVKVYIISSGVSVNKMEQVYVHKYVIFYFNRNTTLMPICWPSWTFVLRLSIT